MIIRTANKEDIISVAKLEKLIEKNNAATYDTLLERFNMFPGGFYIAEQNKKIIGYVESCLWNKEQFESFEDIKDFPKYHNYRADILYVIFMAVHPDFRKNGTAVKLAEKVKDYAINNKIKKINIVSRAELVRFYSMLGLKKIKDLPNFLPNSSNVLMEYNFNKYN